MSDVLKYYLRKSHYVDGFLDPVAAFPVLKEQIISNLPEKRKEKDFQDALTLIALQKGISIEKIHRLIDGIKPESSEEFYKLLAQGGLSVADGCRCLTKELDMIAC